MRYFKAIYFPLVDSKGKRQTKNVALAFNTKKEPYLSKMAKELSSTEIKKLVGIHSYSQLQEEAEKEKRALSDLIKYKLLRKLERRQSPRQYTFRRIGRRRLAKWQRVLADAAKATGNATLAEIKSFFSELEQENG